MRSEIAPRIIAITFDDDLNEKFIRLSASIASKIQSYVVLNTIDMYPHMTVYTTNFPEHNLGKAEQALELLVRQRRPFIVRFASKSVVGGTVFVDAEMSSDLYILHEQAVDALNPLREGLYDEKERELPGFSSDVERSLTQYGMWGAKSLFKPHVTVARPVDSGLSDTALQLLPDSIDLHAVVNKVSLVERGPNGTAKRLLRTFPFM